MNVSRTKALILYVLNHFHTVDIHKVFKILYFADRYHLVNYGRSITKDTYHAMDFGGVPSEIYDVFKIVRGDRKAYSELVGFEGSFKFISKMEVTPIEKPDLDELSASEIESLDKSIKENKDLNFSQLKEKSHDKAWKEAYNNMPDSPIEITTIAKAGGADRDMVSYINEVAENESLSL